MSFWKLNAETKPYLSLIAREVSKPRANLSCVISLRWFKRSHSKGSPHAFLLIIAKPRAESLKYNRLHMKMLLSHFSDKKQESFFAVIALEVYTTIHN